MGQNPEKEWFGEEHVTASEKTEKVIGVFDSVASKYDIMNDLMSGGMHRLWKDRLIRHIRPKPGQKFLDVAGGTGDIAFRIRKKTGPDTNITVFDLNPHMLDVGRDRAVDRGWLNDFEWVTGNAETLPFPDNSFDVYTIAFGLRNVTHIDTALKEAVRVLKSGGRFFCMEFSHVEHPLLAIGYDAFSFHVIPRIGKTVTGDQESYQYLVESIRKFPSQRKLSRRMAEAGLVGVKYFNLSAGIVAIHTGIKP
jgi:ubiquinone/menaquinone biosynthesis methyltransferase